MKKNKYVINFDGFHITNRWKKPIYSRNGAWVYFGISKFIFSPSDFEYIIHLFGIDLRFWFTKLLKNDSNKKPLN